MRKTTCLKDKNRRLGTAFASIMIVCLMITFLPLNEVDADDTSELQGLLDGTDTTITLQKNYTTTSTINISRNVVINGNNYSITYSGTGAAVEIKSGTSITLENLVINAKESGARGLNISSNTTNLTLTGCTINAYQRGISYTSTEVNNGVKLIIDNTHIYNSQITDYDYETTYGDSRGLSLFGIEKSTISIVNGSSIKGFGYSIYIDNNANTADERKGLKEGANTINIEGSTVIGWSAIYIFRLRILSISQIARLLG